MTFINMGIGIITSEYMTKTVSRRLKKRVETHNGRQVVKTYQLPSITIPSDEFLYDNVRNCVMCHPVMVDRLREILKKARL